MWNRTLEDVELSTELNEIARRFLRLEPVPPAVALTAADLAPDTDHGPVLSCLAGLALPRTAARLASAPRGAVRFAFVHGAASIRFDAGRAQAA